MFANNKCPDQPAHPHRLISAFVIRLLESIISKPAIGEILIFWLVIVAEGTDLSLALSETRKRFCNLFEEEEKAGCFTIIVLQMLL